MRNDCSPRIRALRESEGSDGCPHSGAGSRSRSNSSTATAFLAPHRGVQVLASDKIIWVEGNLRHIRYQTELPVNVP
jgi:hypothetical protein